MLDVTFGAGRKRAGRHVEQPTHPEAVLQHHREPAVILGARLATMRITTSFCSMKVMSRTCAAKPARWNSSGVEMLYGRLPTTRSGAPSVPKSNFCASPSWIVSVPGSSARAGGRSDRDRSRRHADAEALDERVGHRAEARTDLDDVSPATGRIASMILRMMLGSDRKFWPKRLRARCSLMNGLWLFVTGGGAASPGSRFGPLRRGVCAQGLRKRPRPCRSRAPRPRTGCPGRHGRCRRDRARCRGRRTYG